MYVLKVLALKEDRLFCVHQPKPLITFHVPKGVGACFLFKHTHAYGQQKPHTHTHTNTETHVFYSRPTGAVPPDSGNTFVKPPIIYAHTHTQTHTLHQPQTGGAKILTPLIACGRQYGLAGLSPCPEEVSARWQPSGASPSRPLTYIWTHTNTETHRDRFSGPAGTTGTGTVIFLARGQRTCGRVKCVTRWARSDRSPACLPA